MPSKSTYPDIAIPDVGLWDFLFERKDRDFPDDKVIYVDPATNRSYTYAQTKQTAIDFGKGLKGLWDWQKGDVLALYTPNCIDTPAVTWGTHWAGGIVSPANPGYTVDELAYQLKDSGAKAIITQLAQLEQARLAAKKVGIPEDRIALMGDEKDPAGRIKHFSSVRNISGTQRYRRVKIDADNDLAFLVYSSGTTGLPKGVMLSHRNIVANVSQLTAAESPLKWQPAEGRPDGDAILAFLPFFHIYGLTCLIHQCLYRGLKCVVLPKFDIEAWCRIVQDHKITMSYVVPPVVLLLTKHPIVEKYDLSSLRMMNSGAAPLTRDLVEATHKRIGVPIKQGYGLSETSPTTHTQSWDSWKSSMGSVGAMLPNMTAKYMSPEEKEVPQGEVGELWLKGPNIFKGYLNNVEGTKNAMSEDGYFKTGDVGYQDENGNFFITDRVKELIKYKGFQVPPAELEGYLVSHEKIDDVAVLGVHKEELATEVPLAYVVLKQGIDASPSVEKEIVEWLNAKVASHKKLRGGVKFTEEIPKSVSGKILRRMLKVKHQEEEAKKNRRAKL
ncbi:acetyl-CoA synthetase-like protein [Sphaerulina musiva SO2202]|uniref:Acetyl-CoA synthetase-like protein n=1 Tax=Sphaerulina musiva (strain SO2202) TaxID=692275 RepID=M3CCD9_SPHMS|nr:acetyl-CoA synthetase-like protein [Sphaerulina musiva SO2202]EMF10052.1 acetyl-CoA synthetase-like protein [Sphaerulina musiva SO2202]